MRISNYFLIPLCVAVIACSKEVSDFPEDQGLQRVYSFTASFSPETKAAIVDNFGNVNWNAQDAVSIFDSPTTGGGNRFITAEGGTTATFEGEAQAITSGYYYAVYPYSQSNSYTSGSLKATVPSSQTAIADSFDPAAFVMVGRSQDTNIGFYDALGGIRFNVEGSGYTKVEFSGNNSEPVAGDVTITFGADGIPVAKPGSSTLTTITLEGEFVAGQNYFISMIPQEFNKGFTLKFTGASGATKTVVCKSYVNVRRYYFGSIKKADNQEEVSKILAAKDLSANGTANCYIVSDATTYKFPLVKGNTSTSVGNATKVSVLWETDNTAAKCQTGSIIQYGTDNLKIKNGYVYFRTADNFKQGNALIAVMDDFGTILWSWHIWACNFDPETTAQTYRGSSYTMMDRNLGALGASSSSALTSGLFYQWGRKDPFMGPAYVSGNTSSTRMASTGIFDSVFCSTDCTVAYSIKNPMTYICCDANSGNDWIYAGRNNDLWKATKTLYDPCPAGWRVPDGGKESTWKEAESYLGYDANASVAKVTLANGGTAWYPLNGTIRKDDASLDLVGTFADYWTVETATQTVTCFEINLAVSTTSSAYGVKPYSYNKPRGEGHSVRCQKIQ